MDHLIDREIKTRTVQKHIQFISARILQEILFSQSHIQLITLGNGAHYYLTCVTGVFPKISIDQFAHLKGCLQPVDS